MPTGMGGENCCSGVPLTAEQPMRSIGLPPMGFGHYLKGRHRAGLGSQVLGKKVSVVGRILAEFSTLKSSSLAKSLSGVLRNRAFSVGMCGDGISTCQKVPLWLLCTTSLIDISLVAYL